MNRLEPEKERPGVPPPMSKKLRFTPPPAEMWICLTKFWPNVGFDRSKQATIPVYNKLIRK
jgi:hypothetical protein